MFILEFAYDKSGHWEKKRTLAKLKSYIYLPNQFKNIAKYITRCIKYAKYRLALRSQPLYPVYAIHLIQLLDINWCGLLLVIKSRIIYIFHIIYYFNGFSFILVSQMVNSVNVICFLRILFIWYHKLFILYCN